jgi:hypothetical protein
MPVLVSGLANSLPGFFATTRRASRLPSTISATIGTAIIKTIVTKATAVFTGVLVTLVIKPRRQMGQRVRRMARLPEAAKVRFNAPM